MKLENIKIKRSFQMIATARHKIDEVIEYYKQNGTFDKPIQLDRNGYLVDGYARYQAAKELMIDEVDVKVPSYVTTLVYGCHSGNPKEYVWKKPDYISSDILPGSKVIVGSKGKKTVITVTKTESVTADNLPPYYIKNVYSLIN